VLTNAIYFLADWLYAFNPENTKNQDFTLLDKSKVTAPIMTLNKPDSTVKMRYGEGSGVKALDFPYKGDRLVMTVLLPDSDAFSTVENSLSAEKLTTLFAGLDTANVKASLPKFKFTFGTVKLKAPFNALGMTDAFIGGKADFSGMDGTRDLYVDDIYHKAFISVDEKGTEAAAATAVVLNWKSIPKQPTFIVDRPFIFAIRDRVTGAILFMGRILNPLTTE
jgi:serpin B